MVEKKHIDQQETPAGPYDHLSSFVMTVEDALARKDFVAAGRLIDQDAASAWFGFRTDRLFAIVRQLVHQLPEPGFFLTTVHKLMTANDPDALYSSSLVAEAEESEPAQQYFLAVFRMSAFRSNGVHREAVEQAEAMRKHQGRLVSVFDRHGGWALHASVQLGISAMLAGDFHRALAAFTEAQLHVPVPAFAFLTRDALVKSALIHASFGDPHEAQVLLDRAERISRTSSWVEPQIDVHRDFTGILLKNEQSALETLKNIQLHDIGEMWPFYVLALHRLLVTTGYQDTLEYQLKIFETLPLPKSVGHGFSGSVVPLKLALLALTLGRGTEAQELISQADPDITYTQLIQAASHLYAGRPKEALLRAIQLRAETSGLRLLEIRRLAIVAAANYASQDTADSLKALEQAARQPRGISPHEARLFSPETRRLAEQHISEWPQGQDAPSGFLTGLPDPGAALSERELVMIRELAQGHPRAQIAKNLYVTLNTVKSQLHSAYRKLGVTSGASAVQEAERRGLL